MNFLKKHKEILFLLVFCIVFFCIYSHFSLMAFGGSHGNEILSPQRLGQDGVSVKFSSPDETANYFWIERVASGEGLYYFEELNGIGNNLVHARSLNTVEGKIVPGSFLGMILIYGFLAKIFGLWIVPFLTPFFAVLGIFFFYLLIKQIFKRKEIALISAVLLSFVPPWLYYSARGMYHNVLFLSLLLMAIYLLFKVFSRDNAGNFQFPISNFQINSKLQISNLRLLLQYFLSGLILGLAIITRTSEIVWIALTVLFIFILNFKKIYPHANVQLTREEIDENSLSNKNNEKQICERISVGVKWTGFVLFLCGLYIPALILMYSNQILYGQVISAGYGAIIPEGGVREMMQSGMLFKILITPFGFNLKSIIINGFNYLYKFLAYWSVPTLIGGFLFAVLPKEMIKINYKKRLVYLAYCLLLIAYLLIFYGSWGLVDRIDKSTLSLGTSYLRYWLPIYILCLPFLAVLIYQTANILIFKKLKYRWAYRSISAAMLIVLLSMPTFNLVIRKTDESLFLQRNLSEARAKSGLVNEIVQEADIVVMYKQADKIFFPERKKLVTDLAVEQDYEALKRLVRLRNVYYYTFAPQDIVEFISKRDFEPMGMKIVEGRKVFGSDWIYKIEIKN
ncbi:MAG: hypothetical protein ABIJ91_03420 [Candidatus Kuenenbacteria bacterium]